MVKNRIANTLTIPQMAHLITAPCGTLASILKIFEKIVPE